MSKYRKELYNLFDDYWNSTQNFHLIETRAKKKKEITRLLVLAYKIQLRAEQDNLK